MRRSIFLAFVLQCLASLVAVSAMAQWSVVAPNIGGRWDYSLTAGGMLKSTGGAIWAGNKTLNVSTDQGLTWSGANTPTLTPLDVLADIDFFDARFGVLAIFGYVGGNASGLYLTTDRGTSWSKIYTGGVVAVTFGSTANDIIANSSGGIVYTHDGGITWGTSPIGSVNLAKWKGSLYTLTQIANTNSACLSVSHDDGPSWTNMPGSIAHWDAYSLDFLDCANRVVLPDEEFFGLGPRSSIFMSNDGGISWNAAFTNTMFRFYIAGSVAHATRAIYCPTLFDGVLRSVDFGATWSLIGGPNCGADSRTIVALDDNTVVAMDSGGSIWRTTNSGGSWVTANQGTWQADFTDSMLFNKDTLSHCDSAVARSDYIFASACDASRITSQGITGPDAQYFQILSGLPYAVTGKDSIIISFHADSARDYHATFVATVGGRTITVALSGHGRNESRQLSFQPGSRLAFDTISPCSPAEWKSFLMLSKFCSPWRIDSARIGGKDAAYFSLGELDSLLTGRDSLAISFLPDTSRTYHATLELVLDDGTRKTLTLSGVGQMTSARISSLPVSPLLFDSVSVCDEPSTRTITLSDSACLKHSIARAQIVGADSLVFRLDSGFDAGSGFPDSGVVEFTGDSLRAYYGTLRVTLDDSSIFDVELNGNGKPVQRALRIAGLPVFPDSLSLCDSERTAWLVLRDSSCTPWPVVSESLTDSIHFQIIQPLRAQLTGLDSILISFHADTLLDYQTVLSVNLGDTILRLPVAAFGKRIQRRLSFAPSTLFSHDTVSICGQPVTQQVAVRDSSCLPWSVASYSWSGADSSYYHIESLLPTPLTGFDTLTVRFMPDAGRAYPAECDIQLSDGTRIPIQFAGVGRGYSTVSLASADLRADTIGADVFVPIVLNHVGALPAMDCYLTYDTSVLTFMGTASQPGHTMLYQQIAGHLRVTIDSTRTESDNLIGYLRFSYFLGKDSCTTISLDSLSLPPAVTCVTVLADQTSSRICGPMNCGTILLSTFVRTGAINFSISPNPATDVIWISTSENPGNCQIRLFDNLGIERRSFSSEIGRDKPLPVSLDGLPSGLYHLSISQNGFSTTRAVIKE
ncbi:MAG: T9SS type A sorting domain-containing protein [Bacteroidota bacterium]|nr:T9SS type A sorting domain-containing protein [Bacteroidota bacterium]